MHRSLSHMQKLLLSFQRQTLYWPFFFRVFTTLSLSVSLTLPLFICDSAGNTESLEALEILLVVLLLIFFSPTSSSPHLPLSLTLFFPCLLKYLWRTLLAHKSVLAHVATGNWDAQGVEYAQEQQCFKNTQDGTKLEILLWIKWSAAVAKSAEIEEQEITITPLWKEILMKNVSSFEIFETSLI